MRFITYLSIFIIFAIFAIEFTLEKETPELNDSEKEKVAVELLAKIGAEIDGEVSKYFDNINGNSNLFSYIKSLVGK
ncbi:Hypothetical protein SRAE_X000055400 [Strongyloides ratti]|uniref:Uncharacterized protein n=1 Tax=Strongyloides ratti TaxID=34506 RepID=A0A090LSR4_STRRB|nr:Hypothetical protein SRAE_X000055400 [Strongyloides ratti]CEF71227.1 Hypothetical protein SRAE_X000055400 [Strongyloides ratti]